MTVNKMYRSYWLFAFLACLAFLPGSPLNAIESAISTPTTLATTKPNTAEALATTTTKPTIKTSSILRDTLDDKTLLKTATTATTTSANVATIKSPTLITQTELQSETTTKTTTATATATAQVTTIATTLDRGSLGNTNATTDTASGLTIETKASLKSKATQDDIAAVPVAITKEKQSASAIAATTLATNCSSYVSNRMATQPEAATTAEYFTMIAAKLVAAEMPIITQNNEPTADNSLGNNSSNTNATYNFIDYSQQQQLQQTQESLGKINKNSNNNSNYYLSKSIQQAGNVNNSMRYATKQQQQQRTKLKAANKLKKQNTSTAAPLAAAALTDIATDKQSIPTLAIQAIYSKLISTTAAAAADVNLIVANEYMPAHELHLIDEQQKNFIKSNAIALTATTAPTTTATTNAMLSPATATLVLTSTIAATTTPSLSISYITPSMPTTMKTTTRRRRPIATTTLKPPPTIDDYQTITSQAGTHAYLPCNVKQLVKKPISWLRVRDGHILTVDQTTFIADQRFQSIYTPNPERWSLQIKYVQLKDEGTYECQVSTEPKASAIVTLRVVEPKTELIGESTRHVKAGSQVKLHCIISQALEPPLFINWFYNQKQIYLHNRKGWRTEIERIELPAEIVTTTTATTTTTTRSTTMTTAMAASSTLTTAVAAATNATLMENDVHNTNHGKGNSVGVAAGASDDNVASKSTNAVVGLSSTGILSTMNDDSMTAGNSILANVAGIELVSSMPRAIAAEAIQMNPTITTITPIHDIRHITTASLIIPSVEKQDSGNYTCSPSNSAARTVVLHVLNGEYSASAITSGARSYFPFINNRPKWQLYCYNVSIIMALLWIIKYILQQQQQHHQLLSCQHCWQYVGNKTDSNCITICNYNNSSNTRTKQQGNSRQSTVCTDVYGQWKKYNDVRNDNKINEIQMKDKT